MPDANASFVGSIPESYDRHLGSVIFEPYADDLVRRFAATTKGAVLEVACGTGILTERLRRALPTASRFVATDLNQPMVDYARDRLSALPGIEWKAADAAALPFPDASFQAVACQFGVMFVPDKDAAFREARRVLARGGVFAFNVWDSMDQNPFGRIAHETIASFFPTDPPTFYLTPFGFYDVPNMRQFLVSNDFVNVSIEHVQLPNESPTARSFAVGLVRGNPVSAAIQDRGLDHEAIIGAVEAALVRAGGDRPFRSRMRAVVVTATAGA